MYWSEAAPFDLSMGAQWGKNYGKSECYIYKLFCFDGGSEGPVMPTIRCTGLQKEKKKAEQPALQKPKAVLPSAVGARAVGCPPAAGAALPRASCCIYTQLASQPPSLGCLL